MDDFSNRLRLRRISKGQTVARAAAACGVTRQTFSNWEAGRNSPTSSNIQKLADYLGCFPTELAELSRRNKKPDTEVVE